MSSFNKTAKDLVKTLKEINTSKPSGTDTKAEVIRVSGDTAWVHIPGSEIYETPVDLSIDVKKGDEVLIRISDGNAWITGNITAPPTDDSSVKKLESKVNNQYVNLNIAAKKNREDLKDLENLVGDGEGDGILVETEYCLHTSNHNPPDDSASWHTSLPSYVVGKYYWKRTKTTYADESVIYSDPILDGLSQLTAETDHLLYSVNNHFWNDNTGAYVSERDKSASIGYATKIGSSGIAQMYNGVILNSFTGSGITYYAYDANATGNRVELVSYGISGVQFNDDVDFLIGNASGSYIKWDSNQNKIIINADTIEMGGSPISPDGNAWYTGTAMTYTDNTAHIYTNSGITDAHVGDMYLNTSTSDVYMCTVAGTANVAKWLYQTNIQGDDGTTIEETRVYYGVSSSGTTQPTTWYSYIPTVSAGQYLWTDTFVRYSDGTHTDAYSVARQGQNGSNGIDVTSQYMGFSSANGLRVYSGNKSSSTYNTSYTQIKTTGIDIVSDGVNRARFSETTRIGSETDFNIQIKPEVIGAGVFYAMGQTIYGSSSLSIQKTWTTDIPYLTHNVGANGVLTLKTPNNDFRLESGASYATFTRYNTSTNNYQAGLAVESLGKEAKVSLLIGSGGINHGVYSLSQQKWIIHIDSNGKICIPPAASSSTKALYITSAGILQTTSSSRSVKKDIEDINDMILDPTKLYNLRVVQFRYKDAETWGDDLKPGFIAEEVMDAYPAAACMDKDGNAVDWEPRNIIPPMLKLLQDQQKQIDELKMLIN